jgi:hypothetical protein
MENKELAMRIKVLRDDLNNEWTAYHVSGRQLTMIEQERISVLGKSLSLLDETWKVISRGQDEILLNLRPLTEWVNDLKNDERYDVRLNAAQNLEKLGPNLKEALGVLRKRATTDGDQYVRYFAQKTLESICTSIESN